MKSKFIARLALRCAAIVLTIHGVSAGADLDWKGRKPVLIQQDGHYGRIARIDGGNCIAGFDHHRSIKVRLSHDNGTTWGDPVTVAGPTRGSLTNTEFLVLGPKDVICLFNFRPERNSGLAFEIRMSRSKAGGESWSDVRTLFTGGKEFENGCWEPSGLVYPSGELRVFFANEAPYTASNEQEISMIRSLDGGDTWSPVERVSFRKNHRDGMPVPVLAPDLKQSFLTIEDNGVHGAFKPVILDITGAKEAAFVSGDSPKRWSALSKPLAAATYAGAPYLTRLPDRRFVLSFQIAESGNLRDSRMAVCVGNMKAESFGEPTYPFGETGGSQLWNSLFVKDAGSIIAVSETTIQGVRGVWAVEGSIRR